MRRPARKAPARTKVPARSRTPAQKKVAAAPGSGPGKVTTFLTFSEHGEEAVKLYVSLFPNSKVNSISRWGPGGPVAEGALRHALFELDGVRFMAMDGGSYFTFGQGFSLFVTCETQEEIDRLWEKLSDGGAPQMCGWVKDRYGVSWQVVPAALGRMMGDKDPVRAKRVTEAMLKMVKLDIAALHAAYDG
jgi:predicted 3-demethylubiquinone-9 3-methyltransferase (glyoxalase superfamily)